VASAASFQRLCVVCVANGSLLALFALVQFFTSPHDTVYWTYNTLGQVYGPFICRNHFAFYLNLCIGLGLGLLLSFGGVGRRGGWLEGVRQALSRPQVLWVGAALALMLASVAFSLSRGGLLSLLGAGGICLLVYLGRRRRLGGLDALVLAGALAVGLLV